MESSNTSTAPETYVGLEPAPETNVGLGPAPETNVGLEPASETNVGLEPAPETNVGLGPAPEINLGLESALTGLKRDKKSIGSARVHGKAGKSSADTDLLSTVRT